MADLKEHRALITGASSGIGAAMARLLARWGCDLTVTARRLDRLEALAAEIRAVHGVQVRCVGCDLSHPDGAETLYRDIERAGEHIDILINNAGFGKYRRFSDISWEQERAMLQLNVVSLVELTRRCASDMLTRDRRGYILNVASIAAYQPVPYFACYAATKSYVRDFSEALAQELKDTNVSVTCICPGGTRTEFAQVAGQTLGRLAQMSMMDADQVARLGLRAMLRRRRNMVTGWMNVISCFLMRFIPRRTAARSATLVLGVPQAALTEPETT